ncbi:MAG: pilus assembly protein PilM [Nitrospirota bacterium]
MKIVGLNIDKGRIGVSIIEKGLRKRDLIDSWVRTFATDTELTDILADQVKRWSGAHIVSSIPGRFFSQRMVQFPFADRKRIEKALPFEIEDNIPFALEEVVIDHLVLDKPGKNADEKQLTSVLAVMLPKTLLQQHLDLLASAGIDPQVIVPSYVGMYEVSRMMPSEGNAVFIEGNDLCLKAGNSIRSCRSFSGTEATSIRHTFKSLETMHGIQLEKAYLLQNNEEIKNNLSEFGISIEVITPEYGGKTAEDPISLGLALNEETNLRKGDFAYRLADAGLRRQRKTLIIAGSAAAFFLVMNIGVKTYLTQSTYGKLDGEIKEIFRQTLPDARLVGDPVEQLRKRLDETKRNLGVMGSGASVLDVMKTVTEGIPKEVRVNFNEFLLEGDRLKLQGEASSFESVDKVKAELLKAPTFSDVAVQDTRMGVDNRVKFRFDIKLKQAI